MKHFTLEEAEKAMPEVARRVQRMVDLRVELLAARPPARPFGEQGHSNGAGPNGSGPARGGSASDSEPSATLRQQLVSEVEALERLGVQVKDVDTGLIDFPCIHPASGETVLLCWHLGEEEIGFWHGQEDGYAGRKPLPFT
jgi:hypothetical protein